MTSATASENLSITQESVNKLMTHSDNTWKLKLS